ncbi:hypothetical protein OIU74_009684 [Salix koriyanagi]|uniref:Uncharacterized protein n=1 Tax=Salix koriyanagi TaxID=2511006 RepID=A0A9Q0Z0S7_9ROSI|nr:hypothetical protein OIU74_009684 [Salix koriyanagi]
MDKQWHPAVTLGKTCNLHKLTTLIRLGKKENSSCISITLHTQVRNSDFTAA